MLLSQINQVSGTLSKLITWGSYFLSWWKCIFLWSIWSWSLSGILAWTDSDAGWQILCSAVKYLHEKSWWNKQVSSRNAFPTAKVILHFDDVHDSISVLWTCFLLTEYDAFSKSFKTNYAYLERRIPRDLSNFKVVQNQNTPGRDLSIQGSCKGRQLQGSASYTLILQSTDFGILSLQQHTKVWVKSGL